MSDSFKTQKIIINTASKNKISYEFAEKTFAYNFNSIKHITKYEIATDTTLNDLTDLELSGVDDLHILKYNKASDKWVNELFSTFISGYVEGTQIIMSGGKITLDQSKINHDLLLNFTQTEHRIINDGGTSETELWSASKISSQLNLKSAITHQHTESDVTDLDRYTQGQVDVLLAAKAILGHTHTESDVTDLDKYTQGEITSLLSLKAALTHTHLEADITDLDKYTQAQVDVLLAAKALLVHTHNDLYYTETELDNGILDALYYTKTQLLTSGVLDARYYTEDEVDSLIADFALSTHNHDDRYYTESEVDALVALRALLSHTHDDRYYTESELDILFNDKASITHDHNTIYYTETELDALLALKASITHTHDDRYFTETEVEGLFTNHLNDYTHANIHTHTNKALLDTYLQTEVDLEDAVDYMHLQGTDSGTDENDFYLGDGTTDANKNIYADTSALPNRPALRYNITTSTWQYSNNGVVFLNIGSGGAGGSGVWGAITGTLSNQTDLQSALDAKAASSHNHDSRYYTESEMNVSLALKLNIADLNYYNSADFGIDFATKDLDDLSDGTTYKRSHNDFTTTLLNKLNGIAESANNYSLPTATGAILGGVKIGAGITITAGVITADTQSDENFTNTLLLKLNAIEALADVTDVTNVTTALNSINANELSDITSSGANIEDAVTKRHTQGTDTSLGTQVEDLDMGDFSLVNVDTLYEETNALKVRNVSGGTLSKGTCVYVTGEAVNLTTVATCNPLDKNTMPAIGIVLADITNNQNGYIVTVGILRMATDTFAGVAGDRVYVQSDGSLDTTEPTSGSVQRIGILAKKASGSGGVISVSIRGRKSIFAAADEHPVARMGSDVGHTKMSFHKYDNTEVAYIDKDGIMKIVSLTDGTYSATIANLKDAVDKKHAINGDTQLGTMAADVNMNTHKLTGLSVPASNGDSIRATTKITEANLETAYDHSQVVSGNPHSVTPTELSLIIGTDVQAYDDGLLSLAGLSYVSDSFIKITATDTYAVRTIAETKTDLSLNNVSNVATDDTAYDATTWNTNSDGATKNAIRDKIETMLTAIGLNTAKDTNVSTSLSAGTINATTYGITSDGGVDDIVLPEADTTNAGLLGADKWDEIVANTLAKHTQNSDTALGAQSENLDMNTHKIIGVVDPTGDQEVATKKYVDDNDADLIWGDSISGTSGDGLTISVNTNAGSSLRLLNLDTNNTNSDTYVSLLRGVIDNNVGAGINSGIILVNNNAQGYDWDADTQPSGTALHIRQVGVGGTGMSISGANNINTAALVNLMISDTQSGASKLLKIDIGAADKAIEGIQIIGDSANAGAVAFHADMQTGFGGDFIQCEVNSVEKFAVDKDGNVTIAGDTTIPTNKKTQYRDAQIYINSNDNGHLDLTADTSVDVNSGTLNLNTYGIFYADSGGFSMRANNGAVAASTLWFDTNSAHRMSIDYDGVVLINNKVQFRDSAIYINSNDDGHLDLTADTSIDLNAATIIEHNDNNLTLKAASANNTRILFLPNGIANSTLGATYLGVQSDLDFRITTHNGSGWINNLIIDSATGNTTIAGNLSLPTGQLKFPATQNASADANTLDDYEEGTWTAALTCGTSGTITMNTSYDQLSYTKVGRKVTITGNIVVQSISSPVGSLRLNLPFINSNITEDASIAIGKVMFYGINALGSGSILILSIYKGQSYATFKEQTTTIHTDDVANHVKIGTQLAISASYFTT